MCLSFERGQLQTCQLDASHMQNNGTDVTELYSRIKEGYHN